MKNGRRSQPPLVRVVTFTVQLSLHLYEVFLLPVFYPSIPPPPDPGWHIVGTKLDSSGSRFVKIFHS